jgi:hypothetical protein
MHIIQPNTSYRIIRMEVAVPASMDEGTVDDALSEMFDAAMRADQIICDWQRIGGRDSQSSADPEEGEIFLPSETPA